MYAHEGRLKLSWWILIELRIAALDCIRLSSPTVGRHPTSSRQMANSRGKHTRHNSYQLTNTKSEPTNILLSHSNELEKPNQTVCFSFYLLWNLILNFIPTGAWMRRCCILRLSLPLMVFRCDPCLAFCNFNSQNGIGTWFDCIEVFYCDVRNSLKQGRDFGNTGCLLYRLNSNIDATNVSIEVDYTYANCLSLRVRFLFEFRIMMMDL